MTGIFGQGYMPSSMECMHASSHGHMVHCIESMWGRYIYTVIWYVHMT